MLWSLYILQSEATGRLYTGITTDPVRRLGEHNGKGTKGARYTRIGRPWRIAYLEPLTGGRSEALKRELAVKKLRREAKLLLVQSWLSSSISNSDL